MSHLGGNGNKPLPRSEDAEKAVLCAALLEPALVMKQCASRVTANMFTPANAILFDTILEWDQPGPVLDRWLKDRLVERNQLDEVGGWEYVTAVYGFVPCADSAEFDIGVVRDRWIERETILLGHDLIYGSDIGYAYDRIKGLRETANQAQTPLIEFLSPSQIKSYVPPPGTLLVGDNHIVRGGIFVIGGPPGVGKSRAAVALAEAGATQLDWLGCKVHCNFKTLIIQNENGRFRLKMEFEDLDHQLLDRYLRICPPPPLGLRFDKLAFRDQVKAYIDTWQPGVVILDPWNAVAKDDKQKDYRETFDLVREVIPAGDDAPALGIVPHTRKPLPNERTSGRALLNLLAGSHILASIPRAI